MVEVTSSKMAEGSGNPPPPQWAWNGVSLPLISYFLIFFVPCDTDDTDKSPYINELWEITPQQPSVQLEGMTWNIGRKSMKHSLKSNVSSKFDNQKGWKYWTRFIVIFIFIIHHCTAYVLMPLLQSARTWLSNQVFNTLSQRQNGPYFPDNISKSIFLHESCVFFSLTFHWNLFPMIKSTILKHWFR